jgi:outer membrane immunogenic protein
MTRTLLLASAAVGVTMLPLGAANAADRLRPAVFDWSGFYAGVHAGLFHGNVHVTDEGVPAAGNLHGPVTGLLFGYNAPSSSLPAPWIGGVEADIGFGDFVGHGIVVCDLVDTCPPLLPSFTYDFDWDAHLRVRAGAPMGNVMPFIAAGLAIAQVQVTESSLSIGNRYFGGTIGAGVDVMLNPSVSGRVEALYDKYLRKTYADYSVDLSGWTVRAALIWHLH